MKHCQIICQCASWGNVLMSLHMDNNQSVSENKLFISRNKTFSELFASSVYYFGNTSGR